MFLTVFFLLVMLLLIPCFNPPTPLSLDIWPFSMPPKKLKTSKGNGGGGGGGGELKFRINSQRD